MIENTNVLEKLENAVFKQDEKGFNTAIEEAMKNQLHPSHIQQTILQGLDRVRKQLLSNQSSLPELLISLDLTAAGLTQIRMQAKTPEDKEPVSIVIGVVEGDPHDLGKNIISLIYKSYGYRVTDLGSQIPKEQFLKAVSDQKADILALSAMMSTTMTLMPEIIKDLKSVSPGTLVMVGGAPLDEQLAARYGADGYAPSAVTVIEQTRKILQGSGSDSK